METHICRAPRAVGTVDETLWAFVERMWNEITWNEITWNELKMSTCLCMNPKRRRMKRNTRKTKMWNMRKMTKM